MVNNKPLKFAISSNSFFAWNRFSNFESLYIFPLFRKSLDGIFMINVENVDFFVKKKYITRRDTMLYQHKYPWGDHWYPFLITFHICILHPLGEIHYKHCYPSIVIFWSKQHRKFVLFLLISVNSTENRVEHVRMRNVRLVRLMYYFRSVNLSLH